MRPGRLAAACVLAVVIPASSTVGLGARASTAIAARLAHLPAGAVDDPGRFVAPETDVVINEVFYLGNSIEDWVELKNTGAATIDVGAWWICARFLYRQLSTLPILFGTDLMLGPGEIVVLGTAMDLNDNSSDLGLYTTSSFNSSAAMVDFLQWGTSSPVGRSEVAAMKGVWTKFQAGSFDFVSAASGGQTVAYCGADSGGGLLTLSGDLTNAVPTQGLENAGVLCLQIFTDGFESGDVSAWSSFAP